MQYKQKFALYWATSWHWIQLGFGIDLHKDYCSISFAIPFMFFEIEFGKIDEDTPPSFDVKNS